MKHRLLPLLGLALLLAPLSHAQTSRWKPDPAHSGVDFTIVHLSISKVHGHFGLADGEIEWNEADITKSKVNITIDLNTVNTNNDMRDKDLRSDVFFDSAKSPTATFSSTSIAKTANALSIAGDLTIHGMKRPVTLIVEGPTGPVTGMDGKQHMGFAATTSLDRTAFALGVKYPTSVIGNEVKLTIDLDLAKQ